MDTIHKIDNQQGPTGYSIFCNKEKESKKEYMYVYNGIILLYSCNKHNVVNEIYLNFKMLTKGKYKFSSYRH